MRICHVIDNLAPGGAQVLLRTFAAEAQTHKIDVVIIVVDQRQHSYADELRQLGADVHVLQPMGLPARVLKLRHLFTQLEIDLVHTHLLKANVSGQLAAALARVPSVATLHSVSAGQHHRSIKMKSLVPLETGTLRWLSPRVIVVGDVVAERHRSRLRDEKTTILYNPLPAVPPQFGPEERRSIRTQLAGRPDRLILLAAGRLASEKGFFDLLEALELVRRQEPTVLLAIAGTGTLLAELNDKIVELGLQEHATLLGYRDDLQRVMQSADIFVSSSVWEGLPLVVMEAMAAGLPIVATDVGDVAHALGDAGLLVPAGHPESLAAALLELLNDGTRRKELGRRARERVLREASPEAWFEELSQIYDSTLSETRR